MGAVQCIDDDLVMGEYDDPVVGDIEICQIRIFLRSDLSEAVSSGMNLQVSIISDRTSVTTGRVVVSWMTVGMV